MADWKNWFRRVKLCIEPGEEESEKIIFIFTKLSQWPTYMNEQIVGIWWLELPIVFYKCVQKELFGRLLL